MTLAARRFMDFVRRKPFFTIKKLLPDSFLLSATAFFLSMTAFLMMIRPDTLRFQSQAKAEIPIV